MSDSASTPSSGSAGGGSSGMAGPQEHQQQQQQHMPPPPPPPPLPPVVASHSAISYHSQRSWGFGVGAFERRTSSFLDDAYDKFIAVGAKPPRAMPTLFPERLVSKVMGGVVDGGGGGHHGNADGKGHHGGGEKNTAANLMERGGGGYGPMTMTNQQQEEEERKMNRVSYKPPGGGGGWFGGGGWSGGHHPRRRRGVGSVLPTQLHLAMTIALGTILLYAPARVLVVQHPPSKAMSSQPIRSNYGGVPMEHAAAASMGTNGMKMMDNTVGPASFGGSAVLQQQQQQQQDPPQIPEPLGRLLAEVDDPMFPTPQFPRGIGQQNPVDGSSQQMAVMPFFWEIPMSGGAILRELFGTCLNLVQASNTGGKGHEMDQELALVQIKSNTYVNVDTTTVDGLQRARELDLVGSGLADVVISPMPYAATHALFDEQRRGRMFTMMRHPIERAMVMHHHARKYEPTKFADVTLLEYAESRHVGDNVVVRFLSGQRTGPLTEHDFLIAQEIVRRKCIMGIFEEFDMSFYNFMTRLGWDAPPGTPERHCIDGLVGFKVKDKPRPKLDRTSEEWKVLVSKNEWDLRLYDYALGLLHAQYDESTGGGVGGQ